jgi:hypothetical protein
MGFFIFLVFLVHPFTVEIGSWDCCVCLDWRWVLLNHGGPPWFWKKLHFIASVSLDWQWVWLNHGVPLDFGKSTFDLFNEIMMPLWSCQSHHQLKHACSLELLWILRCILVNNYWNMALSNMQYHIRWCTMKDHFLPLDFKAAPILMVCLLQQISSLFFSFTFAFSV